MTPQELAAGQYPPTEAACVSQYKTLFGCAEQTAENACEGNEVYKADQADKCVDQVAGLDCSQVRDPDFDTETAAPACDQVCVVE